MKAALSISIKQSPIGKPASFDGSQLTYGWKARNISPADLINHIGRGKPFAVAHYEKGHRKKAHFIRSNMIALDYDGNLSDQDFQALLEEPFIQENAFAVIETYSSRPDNRRARVLIALSQIIEDAELYSDLVDLVIKLAPEGADRAAADPARAFMGSKPGTKANIFNAANVMEVGPRIQLIENLKAEREKLRAEQNLITGDLPADFITAIEQGLGIAPEYNREGFTKKPVRCVLAHHEHDDRNPAAYWHGEKHIYKCFKCHGDGQFALAKDVGLAMGIKPSDFITWTAFPNSDEPQETAAIPDWIIEKLLSLHQLGDFLDHAAAALILLQRNKQVREHGLSGGFTIQEFVDYSAMMGINTNEKTARRGLEQAAALGFYEKEYQQADGKGRPAAIYHPRKMSEALATFSEKLKYRAYERAYGQYTPAVATAAWFPDEDPETAAKLAAYVNQVSAEVYEIMQEDIQKADERYQQLLNLPAYRLLPSLWSSPAEMPEGEISTGRDFRELYYANLVKKRQEQGINITAAQAAAQIGVTTSTLVKIRERLNVVTDEQFTEIDINPEKDVLSQVDRRARWAVGRRYGRYLESTSGEGISVNPDNPAGLNEWVQKEAAAGHGIIAKVQIASLERFTSQDEVQQRKEERQMKYGNRHSEPPQKMQEPELPHIREVLEAFPDTFRPDWTEAQLSLRPVDPVMMEGIRLGAEITELPEENDLIPFLTPYVGTNEINRVQKREKNKSGGSSSSDFGADMTDLDTRRAG